MSSPVVTHPIPVDSTIEALKPICPCKGGGFEPVVGKVLKVIHNQAGYWYYLDINQTVRADRVTKLLK
jgi:hypothetical protein